MRSYTIILAIPIIIFCIFLYNQIYASNRKAAQADCLSRASKTAEQINSKLIAANDMGNQFLTSSWLQCACSNSGIANEYFDPMKKSDISKELDVCKSVSGIFSDIAIIMPEKGMVINQSGWWDSMSSFFSRKGIVKESDQQKILSTAKLTGYTQLVNLRSLGIDKTTDSLVLLQTLDTVPLGNSFIALTFDTDNLNQYLSLTDSGLLKITIRQSGKVLYSYQSSQYHANSQKSFKMSIASTNYPWVYEIELKYSNFTGFSGELLILLAALLLSATSGIVVSYGLALASYKPLERLMMKIGTAKSRPDENIYEFTAIETSFGTIASEKEKLEQAVRQYENNTRSNLLANLLKGYFDTEKIEPQLAQYSIPYDNSQYYTVALCDCNGTEKSADSLLDIFIYIRACLQSRGCPFEMLETPDDSISFIFNSSTPQQEKDIRDSVESVEKSADGKLNLSLSFYIGTMGQGLIGISKSYQSAKEMCISKAFQNIQVGNAAAVLDYDRYFYPTDWEFQIVNQLKVGNAPLIHKIIEELKAENEKRQLAPDAYAKLRSMIFETMIRVMDELNMDIQKPLQKFKKVMRQNSTDKEWEYLCRLADQVCSRTVYLNKPVCKSTGSKILEYVKTNYMDYSLSLKVLSDTFNLSDSAISKIFKDTEKINFYEYLCRIRMEKAKEYLAGGTYKIAEVANMVGYENVLSFKRAFLRYVGVSPREYTQHSFAFFYDDGSSSHI